SRMPLFQLSVYNSPWFRSRRRQQQESVVKHIDLNAQNEEVRRFFLSVVGEREGSVVELNGRAVARVTPVRNGIDGGQVHTGPWTEAKATRRCELVDREIDGTLTPEEALELEVLQQQMLRERQRLAPVPLDELRRLHQELLTKARRQLAPDAS